MKLKLIFILSAVCLFFACTKDTREDEKEEEVVLSPSNEIKYTLLKEYSFKQLKDMEHDFIDLPINLINIIGSKPKYDGDAQMKVYKVMLEARNIDGSNTILNLSGMLIVPPLENGKTYRQVVAPEYTFISRDAAPTVRVTQNKLDSHQMFWILEAYKKGFAVIIPDYPGYGDSYGQCYIPYLEKAAMVGTTVQYVNAARKALEIENYKQRDGLIISGYSLGAYVSLQLARDYETNPKNDLNIDYLIVGGSPCNLLQEANLIRASQNLSQPYLFPLALLGFKKNGYRHLGMNDYLKEPYATNAAIYLDGQHEFEGYFPTKTAELFTESFINNVGMTEINRILDENSVKPWKNKCRATMLHGGDDVTVYYAQAKDFADEMNKNNGAVSFGKLTGDHSTAGVFFYIELLLRLENIN